MEGGWGGWGVGGGGGNGTSRGIEERACGNSRGQLKKKLNFVEVTKKTFMWMVFPCMSLVFWPWNFQV